MQKAISMKSDKQRTQGTRARANINKKKFISKVRKNKQKRRPKNNTSRSIRNWK